MYLWKFREPLLEMKLCSSSLFYSAIKLPRCAYWSVCLCCGIQYDWLLFYLVCYHDCYAPLNYLFIHYNYNFIMNIRNIYEHCRHEDEFTDSLPKLLLRLKRSDFRLLLITGLWMSWSYISLMFCGPCHSVAVEKIRCLSKALGNKQRGSEPHNTTPTIPSINHLPTDIQVNI